jgi:4'-phosphopantetheinyl transferase
MTLITRVQLYWGSHGMVHTSLAVGGMSIANFSRQVPVRGAYNDPEKSQMLPAWDARTTAEMKSPIEWSSPRVTPELANNEIHIWRAFLPSDETTLGRFQSSLADEERARADRFVFERDRNRFVAARGILRQLLAEYIKRSPSELQFSHGPQGKPFLVTNDPASALEFNISHSHDMALFAFARERSLGIDVELLRPEFAGEDIARRYFSAAEIEELRALPPELRTEGFFLCWTRKEAYIKARGEGLQIPLASFSVSLTPGRPETLHSADYLRWSVSSLRPARQYVGAVIGEGKDWRLRQWEWTA